MEQPHSINLFSTAVPFSFGKICTSTNGTNFKADPPRLNWAHFENLHRRTVNVPEPVRHLEISYFTSTPMLCKVNAYVSTHSSIIIEVGFPAPCPAFLSIRMNTGFAPACFF